MTRLDVLTNVIKDTQWIIDTGKDGQIIETCSVPFFSQQDRNNTIP